jgi:hypothetical protein
MAIKRKGIVDGLYDVERGLWKEIDWLVVEEVGVEWFSGEETGFSI